MWLRPSPESISRTRRAGAVVAILSSLTVASHAGAQAPPEPASVRLPDLDADIQGPASVADVAGDRTIDVYVLSRTGFHAADTGEAEVISIPAPASVAATGLLAMLAMRRRLRRPAAAMPARSKRPG